MTTTEAKDFLKTSNQLFFKTASVGMYLDNVGIGRHKLVYAVYMHSDTKNYFIFKYSLN